MSSAGLIVLIAVTFLAYLQAQPCPNQPTNPHCRNPRNEGRNGTNCRAGNRFYYDEASGSCRKMHFRGCGGNNNRFCTQDECQRICANRAENCPNQPRVPECRGRRDAGRGGANCTAGTRFRFDVELGSCREIHYLGCGGNSNRYCSHRHCERICGWGNGVRVL